MSKIDYQALQMAAERAIPAMERLLILPVDDDLLSEQELKDCGVDIDAINTFRLLAGPEDMLALLDELETAKKRIAELEKIATDHALKFQKAQDALKYAALLHSRTAQQTNNFAVLLSDISEYFINNVFQPLRYERDVERAIIKAGGKALWQEKHEERTHQLSDVNSGWLCPLTEGKKNT
ncbi:ead/Ea22-like family protein [Escherichia albertii]|uniref:Ead/Ea22-like family protein n=1 Tax=Escherichia coli TaxID=562 RepID=A0A765T777_ECOLX|nr:MULTISPECIES: ead/Ea22-like family protein [Escherichia]EGM7736666.1 ead/Ea22-like family protein [Escherichia albertii]EHK6582295.1 ead/Ea22-like family protein [Escherichia albertii]EHW5677982.1 ead/Ea22-like family protein [Escherichia albertii]EHW5859371.1 ead/Ea22-like family protein [Escherichia albertii]EJM9604037.1 ead/Ea22-like family protein [Escherichia albertii]